MTNEQRAAKMKLRFETAKGLVTYEDLYDLPLTSPKGVDLNGIAKKYHKLLKDDSECDFVNAGKKDTAYTNNQLRFDLVLSVIEYKKECQAKAEKAAETKARTHRLMEIIEDKKDSSLSSKSIEELEAELAKLRS
jgi:hypothetical protein